ncbi:hypothetical protein [Amycolatopsis tucumanensis]
MLADARGAHAFAAALTCCYVLEAPDRLAGLEFRDARLAGRVAVLLDDE